MNKNKDYLNEDIYDSLDIITENSNRYKELSENLKDRLSGLTDSIEILSGIDEINKFLIKLNSFSKNELKKMKKYGKILIAKHKKHKDKIRKLKSEKNRLEEDLSLANERIDKKLLKIDELTDDINTFLQHKNFLELKVSLLDNDHKININLKSVIKQVKNENEYLKKELASKDEIIKESVEKYGKVNEENENIKTINKRLQKTIEDLKNKFKDNHIIISYIEEQEKKIYKA